MRTKQLTKFNKEVQITFREDTPSIEGDQFIMSEIWREEVYSKHLSANSHIIIDIGAHIGVFSLLAAITCPEAKIYCYEPEPNNYELLIKNIEQNNLLDRLNSYQLGVARSNEERILNVAKINTGGSSIVWGQERNKKITVDCITLKSILEENHIDKVDFVKMDCEGAEFEILYSSQNLLQKIDVISMEVHNNEKERKLIELQQYLESNNFEVESSTKTKDISIVQAYK